jgi:hypothetical protein
VLCDVCIRHSVSVFSYIYFLCLTWRRRRPNRSQRLSSLPRSRLNG